MPLLLIGGKTAAAAQVERRFPGGALASIEGLHSPCHLRADGGAAESIHAAAGAAGGGPNAVAGLPLERDGLAALPVAPLRRRQPAVCAERREHCTSECFFLYIARLLYLLCTSWGCERFLCLREEELN